MKLLTFHIENFASYKDLTFDFNDVGLALIQGPTGSGKSTLQEVVPWILFGITSKGGTVDEIRSWQSDSPTIGTLKLETTSGAIEVVRTRGTAKDNDLYWTEEKTPEKKERGKDLLDTQKKLSARLGFTTDIYCTAAHFNEFSDTNFFFVAKAKEKRALFERLTVLEFPARLAEKATDDKKRTKKSIAAAHESYVKTATQLEFIRASRVKIAALGRTWDDERTNKLAEYGACSKTFETDKAAKISAFQIKAFRFDEEKNKKIDALIDKITALDEQVKPLTYYDIQIQEQVQFQSEKFALCHACKRPLNKDDGKINELKLERLKNYQLLEQRASLVSRLQDLQETVNPYTDQLEAAKILVNDFQARYDEELIKVNPYKSQLVNLEADLAITEVNLKVDEKNLQALKQRHDALNQLYDLSFELRKALLENTVSKIQNNTNDYLERFFDAEIRVELTLPDADSLEVVLFKDGNQCSYSQLSKGQRQLLKLCFSITVMKEVANNSGVHFSTLFLDESLDGLDSELKLKAYQLFSTLSTEHDNILVIDHDPGLKSMFNKSYEVALLNGNSELV